jgi:hypothetical protein
MAVPRRPSAATLSAATLSAATLDLDAGRG